MRKSNNLTRVLELSNKSQEHEKHIHVPFNYSHPRTCQKMFRRRSNLASHIKLFFSIIIKQFVLRKGFEALYITLQLQLQRIQNKIIILFTSKISTTKQQQPVIKIQLIKNSKVNY